MIPILPDSEQVRPFPIFQTKRLAARPPEIADTPAVFAAYASDPTTTRYLSWRAYAQMEPLAAFLQTQAQNWIDPDARQFSWLLFEQETSTLVGSIGVAIDEGKVICGYVIGRAWWGRGYATEALRALADWAMTQPGIYRFWAYCDMENTASARVMEKAGLVREGILRRWHVCPTLGPEQRDCIVAARVK